MGYFRTHWLGRHALAWSFWVSFLPPFALVTGLAQFLRTPYVDRFPTFLILAGAYLILGCLVLYPWQLIGLMRACDRYLRDYGDIAWVTTVHGIMAVSLVVTAVTVFSVLQSGISLYAASGGAPVVQPPGYVIELVAERTLVEIEGQFEPGLSRRLAELLSREHGIRGIVLSSDGGQIYEGRGVAKLIVERRLDTYVFDECKSACTIAYIAGTRRFLGRRGRLGFHRYRLNAQHPFIDVAAEQEKDRTFFEQQGVDPAMLGKIFESSHKTIWFPTVEQLLQARVVHRIVDDLAR